MNPGAEVIKKAKISACGQYRYWLSRKWDEGAESLVFIMLNPSTADDKIDDPTIKKCMKFAKNFGFGGILVLNLFSFRATNPADMKKCQDPIGPETGSYYRDIFAFSPISPKVICAWGTNGGFMDRDKYVMAILRSFCIAPSALRVTKNEFPEHPLYIPDNTIPFLYEGRP
jgi:hypothetical protein